jgi:hypothetical protein
MGLTIAIRTLDTYHHSMALRQQLSRQGKMQDVGKPTTLS